MCDKGWVGRKYLEDSRFGNRLFNTGSGAVFAVYFRLKGDLRATCVFSFAICVYSFAVCVCILLLFVFIILYDGPSSNCGSVFRWKAGIISQLRGEGIDCDRPRWVIPVLTFGLPSPMSAPFEGSWGLLLCLHTGCYYLPRLG